MNFKKMVVFFGMISLLAISLSAQTELVQNGDFSDGTDNWSLSQYSVSSASGSVIDGEYRIMVTETSSKVWNVHLTQTGLSLEEGKTYLFSFDAYKGPENSGDQSMEVNIGQSSSSWKSYFGNQDKTAILPTTKTRYTYSVHMEDTDDDNSRIEFNCGLSTGSFYIDNVSLQEVVDEPGITISPMSLSFSTAIETPVSRTVTLSNTDISPVTWSIESDVL